MNDIESYIQNNLSLKEFTFQEEKDIKDIKEYYDNAKADAIFCYNTISKFLNSDKKILEVGGGIHLLTSFLNLKFDVTSVEPGGFTGFTDELRNKIINKNKLNVHTTTLENFSTNEKFDFIFSMNVLEHAQDISSHLKTCLKLLKDENSVVFIQCPNYSFPFEPHFYEFFLPFLPKFTFEKIKKDRLILQLGKSKYYNIINNLNFECTYKNIKKTRLKINFIHPLKSIFERIVIDKQFRKRILKNFFVNLIYKSIIFLKIEKIFCKLFPKFICPYLIFTIKK